MNSNTSVLDMPFPYLKSFGFDIGRKKPHKTLSRSLEVTFGPNLLRTSPMPIRVRPRPSESHDEKVVTKLICVKKVDFTKETK